MLRDFVVNAIDGKFFCPTDTVPCSPTAQMTACVKEQDLKTDCPITDIKTIMKADYVPALFPGYEVAEAPQSFPNMYLYTRTSSDPPILEVVISTE